MLMQHIFRENGEIYFSLEYLPEETPHREEQINILKNYIIRGLRNKAYRPPIILGPSGTGKTTVIKKVLYEIRMEYENIEAENFNMMVVSSTYSAIRTICSYITPIPERGLSIGEIIERLYSTLEMRNLYFFVGLDDSDELLRRDKGKILEILTRLNEQFGEYRVYPIVVVRDIKPIYVLPDHIRSKLGGIMLRFNPYNYKQLIDISRERIRKGFRDDVISENAVKNAALITEIKFGGNAREMITLLYNAGVRAEAIRQYKITSDLIRQVFFEGYYTHIIGITDKKDLIELLNVIIKELDEDEYELDNDVLRRIYSEYRKVYNIPWDKFLKKLEYLTYLGYLTYRENKYLNLYLPKSLLSKKYL